MTIFSRFEIPFECLTIVLRNAFTILVPQTQIILGISMTIFSRFEIPFEGLSIVLRNAFTILIYQTQPILGSSITCLGQRPV